MVKFEIPQSVNHAGLCIQSLGDFALHFSKVDLEEHGSVQAIMINVERVKNV